MNLLPRPEAEREGGGDRNPVAAESCGILKDTGSTLQTLFDSDLVSWVTIAKLTRVTSIMQIDLLQDNQFD